jgi:hypothetical protein
MSIAALSSASFSQYVADSSNITATQQALQALQQSLAEGNLTAAQAALSTYQTLNRDLALAGGSTTPANTQLATDLNALGTAIDSGDLTAAQSAFNTVQTDLSTTPPQSVVTAEAAAAQTVTEIQDLLSIFNSNTANSAPIDPLTEILDTAYGVNPSSSAASSPANGVGASTQSLSTSEGPTPTSSVDYYA